ncbi:hypothetical protein BJV82DRAFT_707879, partial [Fennellomyces sp. T-0311]
MPDLFSHLPFDIVSMILSHMGQRDCVELMRVCRRWYEYVPSYTTSMWYSIAFDKRPWLKKNDCLVQCLGAHVQRVTVPIYHLASILTELQSHQCEITALEINGHGMHRSKGTLGPAVNARFFNTLRTSRMNLTWLKLDNHPWDISLLEIARTFPQLAYLCVLLDHKVFPKRLIVPIAKARSVLLPNLLFLRLDSRYSFITKIEPLLHHCPHLRSLQLITRNSDWHHVNDCTPANDIDFACVLDLCPHLQYLQCDFTDLNHDMDFPINLAKTSSQTGLRQLKVTCTSDDRSARILPLIEKAKDTLQLLEFKQERELLRYSPPIWDWSGLERITLSQIQSLTLRTNTIKLPTLLDFMRHHPTLELINLALPPNMFTEELMDALSMIRGLTSLYLCADLQLVQNTQDYMDESLLPDNFYLLSSLPSLREIDLSGAIRLSDQSFEVLGNFSSLQTLSLGIIRRQSGLISTYALLMFIARLKSNNHCVQHLTLMYADALDDNVFEALAEIRSLRSLRIVRGHWVTNTGLQRFVDRITSCFVEIHLESCRRITSDG